MPAGRPDRGAPLIGAAILAGSALIALSILYTFRWELAPNSRLAAVARLDRWTGEVVWCFSPDADVEKRLDCRPR